MGTDLDKLYRRIYDIEVAMLTTRGPDGQLRSRAMATQRRAAGGDLWFVTAEHSAKLRDLDFDPHVNLSYYKDRTGEWVSVSGVARLSRDREKIRELYQPEWKAWFVDAGDARHGTPDDPRMVLIGVTVEEAVFLEIALPESDAHGVFKGWTSGQAADVHRIEK